jgi:hypothetical protein
MSVKDILVAAFNKDASSFETAFSSVMKEKVSAAVENKFFAAEEYELDESKYEDEEDEDDEDDEDELDEKKLSDKDIKRALASAKAKPKETVSLKKPPFKMDEEAEQIDELSKSTKLNYFVKATTGKRRPVDYKKQASFDAARETEDPNNPVWTKRKDHWMNKAARRQSGIDKVKADLTKEEAEQIDELSKKTLGSYVKKAGGSDLKGVGQRMSEYGRTGDIKHLNKAIKRAHGVEKAVDRLTKEETDLDEAAKKDWDYTDEALALLKKAEDAGIKIIKKDKYIKGMKSLGPRMPRKANVEALTRALQALKNGDPVRPVEYWVG